MSAVRSRLPILALVFASASAHAGVWLQSAFSVGESSNDFSGVSQSGIDFSTDLTAGYLFPQGFIVGGEALLSHGSVSGNHSFSWGPMGGIQIHGFELTAAFLPSATDVTDGSERDGGGFAVNAGYRVKALGPLSVGVQLTYVAWVFSSQDGQDLAVKEHRSEIRPQLSFAFEF
jgi:hypothetical protein